MLRYRHGELKGATPRSARREQPRITERLLSISDTVSTKAQSNSIGVISVEVKSEIDTC